jgi:hypothetical protein
LKFFNRHCETDLSVEAIRFYEAITFSMIFSLMVIQLFDF